MKITINGEITRLRVNDVDVLDKVNSFIEIETDEKVPVTNVKSMSHEMLKYKGVKEYTGIVETIQKWYYGSLVKAPWCATTVSYFSNLCGLDKLTGKHENVDKMKDYMSNLGRIKMSMAYGGKYVPRKDDIIFFSSCNSYDDCTHVGVVIKVVGENVTWVGGNTSDSINTGVHNMKTNKYVVCFGVI